MKNRNKEFKRKGVISMYNTIRLLKGEGLYPRKAFEEKFHKEIQSSEIIGNR